MIFQHKVVHAMIMFTTYTLFLPSNEIAFAYEELSSVVLSHHKLLYEEQVSGLLLLSTRGTTLFSI